MVEGSSLQNCQSLCYSHVSSNLSLRAINLRESFNGRKAVSKTVNEGSIPSSRANNVQDLRTNVKAAASPAPEMV